MIMIIIIVLPYSPLISSSLPLCKSEKTGLDSDTTKHLHLHLLISLLFSFLPANHSSTHTAFPFLIITTDSPKHSLLQQYTAPLPSKSLPTYSHPYPQSSPKIHN